MNFDGCSKGNPGLSGAGAVIYEDNEEIWGDHIFVGEKFTNNHAEYAGLILGLQQAKKMNIKNILWLPLQPTELLNELLNSADIHLLPQRKGLGELMMPSKLLGMQASGRPIVAMADDDTELKAEVSKCGIVVSPGNSEDFALAIKSLAEQPEKRVQMGNAARLLIMGRSKNHVLSQFESELNQFN